MPTVSRKLYDHSVARVLLQQAAGEKTWPWLRPLKPSLTAPGGSLIRMLVGHTAGVSAMAVTPDGRHVVSGSEDNTLRVWDLATGETKTTLQGHTAGVSAMAVTPDGRQRGVRLRGQHAARLGPGHGGNQNDAPGPYQLGLCRGSHTRWSRRGVRLQRQHTARLRPGHGGNQNDAPGPYQLGLCRGSHTQWSPRGVRRRLDDCGFWPMLSGCSQTMWFHSDAMWA